MIDENLLLQASSLRMMSLVEMVVLLVQRLQGKVLHI